MVLDEDDPASGSSLAIFLGLGILRGPGSDIDLSFLWVLAGLPGACPGVETYLKNYNICSYWKSKSQTSLKCQAR